MPTIQPVVLNDGTTNRTFNPVSRQGSTSQFATADKPTQVEEASLKLIKSSNTASERVIARLDQPQTSTVDGVTVAYEHAIGEINVRLPKTMTDAQRVLFVASLKSVFDDSLAKVVLETSESVWG